MIQFRTEPGMENFTILFALYEGGGGNPATEADVKIYASNLGITEFPVMADGNFALAGATPMTQQVHPELCVLDPNMKILECTSGHNKTDTLFDAIRAHAAANPSE